MSGPWMPDMRPDAAQQSGSKRQGGQGVAWRRVQCLLAGAVAALDVAAWRGARPCTPCSARVAQDRLPPGARGVLAQGPRRAVPEAAVGREQVRIRSRASLCGWGTLSLEAAVRRRTVPLGSVCSLQGGHHAVPGDGGGHAPFDLPGWQGPGRGGSQARAGSVCVRVCAARSGQLVPGQPIRAAT